MSAGAGAMQFPNVSGDMSAAVPGSSQSLDGSQRVGTSSLILMQASS